MGKYAYVLDTQDAQQILSLNGRRRIHTMDALATLSKYTGQYDVWKNIRLKYKLKWSNSEDFTFSIV